MRRGEHLQDLRHLRSEGGIARHRSHPSFAAARNRALASPSSFSAAVKAFWAAASARRLSSLAFAVWSAPHAAQASPAKSQTLNALVQGWRAFSSSAAVID